MRGSVALAVLCVAGAASADPARPATAIEGRVMDTSARWTSDGSRIVTEATVRTADGSLVTVSQLGGTAGGFTMRQFPAPERLAAGMQVALAVREAADLDGRMHRAVEGVRVLAYPEGFVRTGPTKAGNFLSWPTGCAFLTPDASGTSQIAGDGEFEIIDAALAEWNTKTAGCSYLELRLDARRDHEVGRDNLNMIKFREVTWCRPPIKDDPMRCYADAAAGITTAVYVDDKNSARDGEIVDADIELNGVNFAISKDGVSLGSGIKADLANTLTHELGHFMGLEHTCLAPRDPPRIDGDGNPVPACGVADPKITEATMFPFQDEGETKKATVEADDVAGVCAIYPIAKDPGTCASAGSDTGCCSASNGSTGAVAVYAGLGLVALGALRRKPRVRR
ncbi:MAG: hypothetical protein KF773_13265 [Deltaproteobacteria bacterium]|nr:hypothetical protein [Deltaproteobacteria bacterium]